ncbi:hypothetical protein ALC60_06952 [Trachymyrmex zeteki]|uniref:HAT C-terminal dimerisation domain-containing protein n=1 Tax=Mycetomoellerius zeteki TaxID=64791 RepID=A0A151X1M7_9HYME|nr:hypothetical protein ALC60_06952 [Trachymyrmex zeteki]
MAVFWHKILSRFNATSSYLQKVELDLNIAKNMMLSLVEFFKNLRYDFSETEKKSKALNSVIMQEYSDVDKRRITKKLKVKRKKKHYRDPINLELKLFTIEAYAHITEIFEFLCNLLTMDKDEIKIKAQNLVKIYHKDLQIDLIYELEQLIPMIKSHPQGFFSNLKAQEEKSNFISPFKVLNWIVQKQMIDVFPNVYIALRIFVTTNSTSTTIPIANCEAERSFSVLKRIKNMYRAVMLDEQLTSLTRLAIESELLRSIDFNNLVQDFVKLKLRKKILTKKTKECVFIYLFVPNLY